MCHVWNSVMDSLFLRFSCTISNPVSMQELGIVVNFYVKCCQVYICRRGLHTMHAYALQFAKCHATKHPPDIILHRSFTRPSTTLAVIVGLGTRLPDCAMDISLILRLLRVWYVKLLLITPLFSSDGTLQCLN